jgi:subtilisin family serine protease
MVRGSKTICYALFLLGLLPAATPSLVAAQTASAKKTVTSEADLPRFSYPVTGSASDLLLSDDATFNSFAQKVTADVNSILTGYDIQDKAALRGLLYSKLDGQILSGDTEGAATTLDKIRDLEEKPEAKMMSGLTLRACLQARKDSGAWAGPEYEKAFAKDFTAAINALPWAPVQDRIKGMKANYQILSPDYLVSELKVHGDPEALRSKSIDFPRATDLLDLRVLIKLQLPVKNQIVAALTPYIDAHNVQKPDIWPAREVTLIPDQKLTPVRVAILDTGVDTALYTGQLYTDPAPGPHGPHGLAYDTEGKIYAADLQLLTAEQKELYPKVLSLRQGFDDLQSNIDSPAAADARKYMSTTPPDKLAPVMKQMAFLGQYMHGTHVAGIAVRGNPAARLVVVQFYDSLPEIPFAPTMEWANRFKADFKQIGEYFRDHDVRVVNMSWSDSQSEIESWLTTTSSEKDPTVRKQQAAQIYRIWKDGIEGMIQAAPKTLFTCAAGNSDSNAGFLGDVPASLHQPNLVTVGAVDQAGEETSFTSYGDTVVLHADGFQVDSFVPGGTRLKFSGTSMASPNVANLAAKLIALDPSLTPEQTIALMKKGAETSPDGRRHLINPKATVALLREQAK